VGPHRQLDRARLRRVVVADVEIEEPGEEEALEGPLVTFERVIDERADEVGVHGR
jgi:hypothetical protein